MAEIQHPEKLQFLRYLQFEKRYSRETILAYDTDISSFFRFIEERYGESLPAQIQGAQVRTWLASLKEQGLSARTLNRKISALKSFFKYLLRTGAIESTPMTHIISPKAGKRLPVFVKEADMQQVLGGLSALDGWKALNGRLLIAIFYATGMRLSELIKLKDSQVDESKQLIKIFGKGNKERLVPVSPELIALIREYRGHRDREFDSRPETLLVTEKGRPLYPKYAYLLVKEYLGAVRTLDKRSPHVLRHSFATHLSNQGADLNAIKELLGHASLAATQVYTHTSIEKLKDVHSRAHPKA